jgi:hypothetical protein
MSDLQGYGAMMLLAVALIALDEWLSRRPTNYQKLHVWVESDKIIKTLARAILLLLLIGLEAVSTVAGHNAWMAIWALVVTGSGMGYVIWSQSPASGPIGGKISDDGVTLLLAIATYILVGGLILALAEGLGWWSLAVAVLSIAGFVVIIIAAVVAEFGELFEEESESHA